MANDVDGTISKVEFYNGKTLIGVDNTFPYSFDWQNVSAGTFTIKAIAYDNLNLQGTSAKVIFTVISGCNATVWSSNSTYIVGNTVTFNGHNYTDNWWSQNNQPDLNTKSGQWTDNGQCAISNNAPLINITFPLNNAEFTEGDLLNITVNASDSDGNVDSVRYFLGSNYVGTSKIAPFNFISKATLGNFDLTAIAYDNSKNAKTSTPKHFIVHALSTDIAASNVSGFILYPNPTSGMIYLDLNVSKVEIMSSNGKELILQFIPNTKVIDIQHLPSGVYLLKFEKDNKYYHEKIIKL